MGGVILDVPCEKHPSAATDTSFYHVCTLGWVNLYQKLKIEKMQLVVKSFHQKKNLAIFLNLFFAQMYCGFAWICEFLQASSSPHF